MAGRVMALLAVCLHWVRLQGLRLVSIEQAVWWTIILLDRIRTRMGDQWTGEGDISLDSQQGVL